MAQHFNTIGPRHRVFIERQHLFFVGTAARDGRVNVSPKGMDTLRVTGDNEVVWLNATGSGNETAAHLLDTNRMTLMWCSFEREPLILRVYGAAEVVHTTDERWSELERLFPTIPGARQIFVLAVDSVQSSCGYAVPFLEFSGERDLLTTWATKKGDGLAAYQQQKNARSIDGLPTGLPAPTAERP